MKNRFYALLTILCMALVAHAQQYDAVLMAHFGTTHDDTRTRTIEALNQQVRLAFPDMKVKDCFTSKHVTKRMAQRGVKKDLPLDALLQLRAEGCRRIFVQPSFLIDGREMDMLRQVVEQVRPFFDDIHVGTPLLYSVEDAQRVCDILVGRHAADVKQHRHVLFVGHGTEGPATAIYSQLDYMLRAGGNSHHHVATIEGFPTLQTAIGQIRALKGRRVTLVPLLFVAGDHATNDIAGEWKEALEKEGFAVDVAIEGLGEVPEIQALFVEKMK